mgnify:CR=1 FL=1
MKVNYTTKLASQKSFKAEILSQTVTLQLQSAQNCLLDLAKHLCSEEGSKNGSYKKDW